MSVLRPTFCTPYIGDCKKQVSLYVRLHTQYKCGYNIILTLGLQSCPHEGEGVASQLSTRAGDGSTGQYHQHTRVVRAVP